MIGRSIKQLIDKRGIGIAELSRLCGIPATTLHSIIKRDNNTIDMSILLKVCEALEIPVEHFLREAGGAVPELPDADEWELIRIYRALDGHGREMTRLVAETESRRMREHERELESRRMREREESDEDADEGRIIPLFTTPAAAGYISPALGEDYENYTVPGDSPADFAVHIQGDSMEPYIEDGSIALVRRQLDLLDGDVGLFFVDGSMKCKQYCADSYGNVYLFSLNRERSDADVYIPASSDIALCCYGKVILPRRPPLP